MSTEIWHHRFFWWQIHLESCTANVTKSQFHTNLTLIDNPTLKTSFHYRSQTNLREGNVFTPVCLTFCSQGGCLPLSLGGVCLWVREGRSRGVSDTPRQTPRGRHPQVDRRTSPPGRHPQETATETGSTHFTRMHSCSMKSQTTSRRLKLKFRSNRKFHSFVCI